jgi:hypothetical protein
MIRCAKSSRALRRPQEPSSKACRLTRCMYRRRDNICVAADGTPSPREYRTMCRAGETLQLPNQATQLSLGIGLIRLGGRCRSAPVASINIPALTTSSAAGGAFRSIRRPPAVEWGTTHECVSTERRLSRQVSLVRLGRYPSTLSTSIFAPGTRDRPPRGSGVPVVTWAPRKCLPGVVFREWFASGCISCLGPRSSRR